MGTEKAACIHFSVSSQHVSLGPAAWLIFSQLLSLLAWQWIWTIISFVGTLLCVIQ